MNKVTVFSPLDSSRIKRIVKSKDLKISQKNFEFMIVYGGDGSVLMAERKYPSVPKLIVKYSTIVKNFEYTLHKLPYVLEKIKKGDYKIHEELKLEAKFKQEKLLALNEFQVRTSIPIRALRFSVSFNEHKFKNLIGDGVLVSTPFGSTGYYKSIGGKPFKNGIGIAFNNLHNIKIKPIVINENSRIKVKIVREEALLLCDNYEKFFKLKPGDSVTIKKSKEFARFIKV